MFKMFVHEKITLTPSIFLVSQYSWSLYYIQLAGTIQIPKTF